MRTLIVLFLVCSCGSGAIDYSLHTRQDYIEAVTYQLCSQLSRCRDMDECIHESRPVINNPQASLTQEELDRYLTCAYCIVGLDTCTDCCSDICLKDF